MVRTIFAVKGESLKWSCDVKIKERNSGRNQQKLFSTGFPNTDPKTKTLLWYMKNGFVTHLVICMRTLIFLWVVPLAVLEKLWDGFFCARCKGNNSCWAFVLGKLMFGLTLLIDFFCFQEICSLQWYILKVCSGHLTKTSSCTLAINR